MSARRSGARIATTVGWLLLALGVAVFAIRLQHAGPYDPPEGGNLAYAAQRLATRIGIFGKDAAPTVVALRLDPCPPDASR